MPNDGPVMPDSVARLGGQGSTTLSPPRQFFVWRPSLPGAEDLHAPPCAMVAQHPDDHDEACFKEQVESMWQELRGIFWIHVDLHPSHARSQVLDTTLQHIVLADSDQFPTWSTWRGGILEIELNVLDVYDTDVQAVPICTRIPARLRDILIQLNLEAALDDYDVYSEVDGDIFDLSEAHGRILRHGFFLRIDFTPKFHGCREFLGIDSSPSRSSTERHSEAGESEVSNFPDDVSETDLQLDWINPGDLESIFNRQE